MNQRDKSADFYNVQLIQQLREQFTKTSGQTIQNDRQYLINIQLPFIWDTGNENEAELQNELLNNISAWLMKLRYPYSSLSQGEPYTFCLYLGDSDRESAANLARKIFDRFSKSWLIEVQGLKIPYYCIGIVSMISLGPHLEQTGVIDLFEQALLHTAKTREIFIYDEVSNQSKTGPPTVYQTLLREVLDNIGLNIFITEVETNNIMWLNHQVREKYTAGKSVIGQKCYKVFHDRHERCQFCKINSLLEDPRPQHTVYEHYNQKWDRYFIVYQDLIPWENGKLVQIEYTLDITEHKKTQKQLEYFATTDVMTGAMNRNTLMVTLKQMLHQAHIDHTTMSIAFIDADGLKQINDTYGHHVGDALLTNIVTAISTSIRKNDIIGRFGGDEFVVLFPNCKKEAANKRILRAQEELLKIPVMPKHLRFSFSYGLSENTEINYQDSDCFVSELLLLADQRLMQKKALKKSSANIILTSNT